MERPPADPRKLQATWAGWVAGEATPGRVVADFKTGGLRDVLEHRASSVDEGAGALLVPWLAWEKGDLVPEQLLAELATAGLPGLLADLVSAVAADPA